MKKQDILKVFNNIKAPDESVEHLIEKLNSGEHKKKKIELIPKRHYKKIAFITVVFTLCIIIISTPASAKLIEYGQSLLQYLGFNGEDNKDIETFMQEGNNIAKDTSSDGTTFSISSIAYSNNIAIVLLTVSNPNFDYNENYKFDDFRVFYELKDGTTPTNRKLTLDLSNCPYGMSSCTYDVVNISEHSISYTVSFDIGNSPKELSEISIVFVGFGEAYLEELAEGGYLQKYNNYSDSKWVLSWAPKEIDGGRKIDINKQIYLISPYDNESATWIVKNITITPFSLDCNVIIDNQSYGEFIEAIIWKDGIITNLRESGEEFAFSFTECSENSNNQKETIIFNKIIDPDKISGIVISGQKILFE